MKYFEKIVAAIVAAAASVETISAPARFGQFAVAEKALRENFAELVNAAISAHPEWNDIYEEIPMDVDLYISAAMAEIKTIVRDMHPEVFDFEGCGRKTVIEIGSSEFSGSKFYRHDSGKIAVEASSWVERYRDVDFDDYGRPYDCDHIATNVEARAWVRYERNPNTGQGHWLGVDSGDRALIRALPGDAAELVRELGDGFLPKRLPEGWHEVPELDFGRDGKATAVDLYWADVAMPDMRIAV